MEVVQRDDGLVLSQALDDVTCAREDGPATISLEAIKKFEEPLRSQKEAPNPPNQSR